mgnify:CR=1 FL=1
MALESASRDHQLADEIHQRVESIEADADARAHPARRGVATTDRRSGPRVTVDALGRARDALGGDDWLEALRAPPPPAGSLVRGGVSP